MLGVAYLARAGSCVVVLLCSCGLCRCNLLRTHGTKLVQTADVARAQVVVYATEMLANGTSAELVHLRNQSVEKLAVVADNDSRAVKGVDSLLQHLLRCHVQVIGRLVEDEQVHRLKQQLYHSQTATLAARQHLHLFVDCLASEHERSKNILYLQTYVALSHAVDCVEHAYLAVEQLRLILGEVANLHVVAHL